MFFAGFPFKLKGVDILIEAFKKVALKYPDWRLKILGWYLDITKLSEAIAGHPRFIIISRFIVMKCRRTLDHVQYLPYHPVLRLWEGCLLRLWQQGNHG